MKKLVAVMVLGLLPLAGCANPRGASYGPYMAYDSDYDQGYDGYDQRAPYYGQPGYGPDPSAYGPGAYGAYGAGYPAPGNQSYYGRSYYESQYSQSDYGRSYGPGPSGYASSYSSPPPAYGPSPYYSTYYRCGCGR